MLLLSKFIYLNYLDINYNLFLFFDLSKQRHCREVLNKCPFKFGKFVFEILNPMQYEKEMINQQLASLLSKFQQQLLKKPYWSNTAVKWQ